MRDPRDIAVARALRAAAAPDETDARDRAWRVVDAAFAARPPHRRRRTPIAAAVAVAATLAAAAGVTSPAVGDWLHELVRPAAPRPERVRPVLGPLPGHGRLLVTARSGAWIVRADGTRRRLGAYTGAAFSPRGLFVAVTRANLLAAVDPLGRVRWTLSRPSTVTRPAWSPDGFRVAYRTGQELRVVYGDGAFDRRLVARSAAVTPAWWPGPDHRLALVEAGGRTVALRDADTARLVWRTRAGGPVRQLAWSPDGRRLLVVTPRVIRVLAADGRRARNVRISGGRQVAWFPGGRRFAALRTTMEPTGDLSEILLAGRRTRRLLAIPGRLAGVLASPDGHRLLIAGLGSGQWLLLRTSGTHLTAISDVGLQFDPGARRPAPPPRPLAWIR